MSFTIVSAALLLFLGVGIFRNATRGYRHGLAFSAISLAAVVFSALAAIPLARWLSNYPAALLARYMPRWIPALKNLTEQFPSIETLLPACLDVLLSPLLFILFYGLIRGVICKPVEGLLRRLLKLRDDEPDDPIYEGRNAPWHRRHTRLLGSVTGGFCGFVVALILLSPLVGLLSVAGTALDAADDIRLKWSAYGLDGEQVQLMRDVVNDPVAKVMTSAGGGVIYDATTITYLRGSHNGRVCLRDEVRACSALVVDLMDVRRAVKDMNNLSDEEKALLSGLGGHIEDSEVMSLVAADVVNQAADAWLEGQSFMKIQRPVFNDHLEPLIQGALDICSRSTEACVGRDISTLVDICIIASENGLMKKTVTYNELVACLERGGVIDLIYNEILDNPCTAPLANKMTDVAVHMMASAIDDAGFEKNKLKDLMTNLSDSMNRINRMDLSNAERVAHMKEYTKYYTEMYGIKMPGALAEMAAVAFVEKLGGANGQITADQIYSLFDVYIKGK